MMSPKFMTKTTLLKFFLPKFLLSTSFSENLQMYNSSVLFIKATNTTPTNNFLEQQLKKTKKEKKILLKQEKKEKKILLKQEKNKKENILQIYLCQIGDINSSFNKTYYYNLDNSKIKYAPGSKFKMIGYKLINNNDNIKNSLFQIDNVNINHNDVIEFVKEICIEGKGPLKTFKNLTTKKQFSIWTHSDKDEIKIFNNLELELSHMVAPKQKSDYDKYDYYLDSKTVTEKKIYLSKNIDGIDDIIDDDAVIDSEIVGNKDLEKSFQKDFTINIDRIDEFNNNTGLNSFIKIINDIKIDIEIVAYDLQQSFQIEEVFIPIIPILFFLGFVSVFLYL